MRNIILSPNSLNDIQLCARKFYFSKVLGKTPIAKPAPLEKGDLLHQMLEAYYKGRMAGEGGLTLVDKAIDVGRRLAVTLDLPVSESERIIQVFREYCVHQSGETWIPLAVEEPFSREIYFRPDVKGREGIRVLLEGRIDLKVLIPSDNITVIVDHKSRERNKESIKLSNQNFGYAWVHDIDRVMMNYIGFQKSLKPHERFVRVLHTYSKAERESWRNETIFWFNYIEQLTDAGVYPANFTSCDKFSGCIYREVCSAAPERRESKLAEQFTDRGDFNLFSSHDSEAE